MMITTKHWLTAVGLCLATSTQAQQADPKPFAETITQSDLRKHLEYIAGPETEGRETGTEGQRKAAAYIEAEFKKMGVKSPASLKSYQQMYPLYRDSMTETKLIVGDDQMEYGDHYITPASSNDNAAFKADSIVFVGYGIEDPAYSDYAKKSVAGKVVVFLQGEPKKDERFFIAPNGKRSEWSEGTNKKLALAKSKGAVGALVINPNQNAFQERAIEGSRKTNQYFPRKTQTPLPYAIISHRFANRVLNGEMDSLFQQARFNRLIADSLYQTRFFPIQFSYTEAREVVEASNVVAVIEGTDKKNEYVVLTAHYDHLGKRGDKIFYGADDDGSGTVAVMEMAEAFQKAKAAGKGPRRTIVCMTVSGEEKGLWGSEYYSENPLFPLEKTTVNLNIDMIGRIDTERTTADTLNYVYVVGHDKISSELPVVNEAMNAKYTGLTLDYKFDDPEDPNRIYFRSDHYNFARKGVPVLFFYDGMLKSDYHKPTDTIEKLYWSLFEKRARMIFYTAWEMANRENMLVRDKPIPTTTR